MTMIYLIIKEILVIILGLLKMIKILVILFITKLYTRNNIFKHVKKIYCYFTENTSMDFWKVFCLFIKYVAM